MSAALRIDALYHDAPLMGFGRVFVREADDDELALLMAAIGWCESNGGKTSGKAERNPFGLMVRGGRLRKFPSYGASIAYLADLLRGPLYLGDGRDTVKTIGARYCPVGAKNDPQGKNKHWVPCVTRTYRDLGGTRFISGGSMRFIESDVYVGGPHPTSGLRGFPARDYMADGGSLVRAPFSGKVPWTRPIGWLSHQDPKNGFGGQRMYLDSRSLVGKLLRRKGEAYMAHFGELRVKRGQKVEVGAPIGRVWSWPGNEPRSHIHFGFTGGDPLRYCVDATGTILAAPSLTMRRVKKAYRIGGATKSGRWQVLVGGELRFQSNYRQAKAYKNATARQRKRGAPYVVDPIHMELEKVGKPDCIGRSTTRGRWQVRRDGEIVFQGKYQEAKDFYREKADWAERVNRRRA